MPKNSWKKRTNDDVKMLKKLVKANTPTRVMWLDKYLWRSEASIRSKSQSLWLSLKPVNQSPYNKKKK